MNSDAYDVVVIGGGPAGYVAAIRASQLGLKTAVVEREHLGGICANWGCIPSKALLRNAEVVWLVRRAKEFGIVIGQAEYHYGAAIDRSRNVVQRLVSGVQFLMKKNRIDVHKEEATIAGPTKVRLKASGGMLSAKAVIVATGARPRSLAGVENDGRQVITYRQALEQRQQPASVVIIGAGAVGVEFAYLYNAYGAKVTLLEALDRVVPLEDEEVSRELARALVKQGIRVETGARVQGVTVGAAARVAVTLAGKTEAIEAETVLVAVGVQPNSEGLGLEAIGVATERSFITVDDQMQTNVPGLYAIGDVTGKVLLAHVGSAQGVLAAEAIAGRRTRPLDYRMMPRATYCHPQVASFGLTERQARETGRPLEVGKFPFSASGKALALGDSEGFIKLVADGNTGDILGGHLVGPEVTELLAELGIAQKLEATWEEFEVTVHSHPTLSEAVKEAALALKGAALHV